MLPSLTLAAFIVLAPAQLASQVVRPVTREVPSQYTRIQAAIDAARTGDSVVVAPGHYVENIRYKGKSIVLASRFARSRDAQDILNTVIDGSRPTRPDSGSAVMIVDREDSTTVLEGFTIVGGPGTVWHDAAGRAFFREGGGVLCELSSATIRFNRIIGGRAVAPRDARIRSAGGGGIRCGYAEPTIEANLVAGNRGRYGAGVVLFHSAATVRWNLIAGNTGGEDFGGAGMWMVGNLSRRLSTVISHNTISGNTTLGSDSGAATSALGKGGGILLAQVNAQATGNLVTGNVQPASSQVAQGPGVQGLSTSGIAVSASAVGRLGPFGVPSSAGQGVPQGAMANGTPSWVRDILRVLATTDDRWSRAVIAPDLVARRRELLATDSALGAASTRGIAARLTEPLAPDAIVIGPRVTLWRSAAETRTALLADTANARATVKWVPIKGDVSADGTEGYTFGFLDLLGGSSPRRDWKYLAYWRRGADGRWKVVAHKRLPREAGLHASTPPAGFDTPTTSASPWFPSGPLELAALMSHDTAFARAAQASPEKAFIEFTAATGATLSGGPEFAWGPEKVAHEFARFEPGTIDWAPDVAAIAPSGDLGFATGEVIIREKKKTTCMPKWREGATSPSGNARQMESGS